MYGWKKSRFYVPLLFGMLFSFGFCLEADRAEAHYFSVIPTASKATVGSSHPAILSFTHIFTEAQMSASYFGLDASIFSAKYHYNNGAKIQLPAFQDYDDPNGTAMTGFDSYISLGKVERNGTVILEAGVELPMGPETKYFGHTKQILNAEAYGFSMTTLGENGILGEDMVEIVPMTDLAKAFVGQSLQFKILFRGQPLANAEIEWADEKSEVFEGDEGPENLQSLGTSDAEGVFSFSPQNQGLSFLAVMHSVPATGGTPMSYYSGSLIFNVQSPSSGSGGGCNAGVGSGASAFLLLPLLGFALLRRNAR